MMMEFVIEPISKGADMAQKELNNSGFMQCEAVYRATLTVNNVVPLVV